jgi:hypothetical protein
MGESRGGGQASKRQGGKGERRVSGLEGGPRAAGSGCTPSAVRHLPDPRPRARPRAPTLPRPDGEYACPITGKVFTDHTHIVAVKTTGNVYAWEAVEELNVKAKNWRDLVTEEPFTRKDILHLQDPLNLSGRLIDSFDHVKRVGVLFWGGRGGGG